MLFDMYLRFQMNENHGKNVFSSVPSCFFQHSKFMKNLNIIFSLSETLS